MREGYIWLRRMAQRYGFGFVVNILNTLAPALRCLIVDRYAVDCPV